MNFRAANDIELFQSALAGNEDAFVSLYRRWQAGVYRFALRLSGSEAMAEDVTQEVFMAIIAGSSGFDAARGTFSAYLYGIARNHVLRRIQREPVFAAIAQDEQEDANALRNFWAMPSDPLGELTRRENADLVHRAIAALPLRYREVVVLCELQELSYAEAAGVIGCPEGTVRSRLHRARALLLEKLRPGQKESARAAGMEAVRYPL
jgi:RNA polymerase sigma-70 factor (ECF subfamily)